MLGLRRTVVTLDAGLLANRELNYAHRLLWQRQPERSGDGVRWENDRRSARSLRSIDFSAIRRAEVHLLRRHFVPNRKSYRLAESRKDGNRQLEVEKVSRMANPGYDVQLHLQYIYDRVKHEDDLGNHRLTWLLTLQGLLFTAFALLTRDAFEVGRIVIGVTGFVSSVSVGYSTLFSHRALARLHPILEELAARIEKDLKMVHPERVIAGPVMPLLPWLFLPWVFVAAWFVLMAWTLVVGR